MAENRQTKNREGRPRRRPSLAQKEKDRKVDRTNGSREGTLLVSSDKKTKHSMKTKTRRRRTRKRKADRVERGRDEVVRQGIEE